MTNADRAAELFAGQCNCAQAILTTYGPALGLAPSHCLGLAAPFGGGIGRTGETCGAVIGAIMVLGLRTDAAACTDPAAKTALYERVREFLHRFKARHSSAHCRDLLGCDVSTLEGWQQARDHKLHETVCPTYIRAAAEILDELAAGH